MARKCMCGVYLTGTTSVLCGACEEAEREADAARAKAARAEEQHKAKPESAEVVNLAARRGSDVVEMAAWLRELATDMEAGKITALMVVGVTLDGEARPGDVATARLRYTATTEDKLKLAGLVAAASLTLNLSLSKTLNMVAETR